ncbi:hypothetical protein KM176_03630 [Pseudooceanicola sp. CBS1P-1]|uniref:Arginine transporter n=1 Tax=Pseudooceanicola albus TaxID=2692189 RepID=A0A6L7G918_9RHOB|nr:MULTISPECIES: hypothetical protein [Pseudooceanicola]MBT9382944.1 hypothetical protein [Pseudooceanicola endophyticus]MXN20132.1 hypothetical protein [Pseudooceanicola albus]
MTGTFRTALRGGLFPITALAFSALVLCALPQAGQAGPIDNACMSSGQRQANARVCSCLQAVANQTLGRGDQKLAAKLMMKPEMIDDLRQSPSGDQRAFWSRYTIFGTAAQNSCS